MIIWTRAYRPFTMGGDVHRPIKTEVEASEPFALGKGYFGRLVVSPSGHSFVAETETGGIVGNTPPDVMRDVATADEAVMREQIEDARKQLARAEMVTSGEFWNTIFRAREVEG